MEDVWLKLRGASFEKWIETGIDEARINKNDTIFGKISPSSAKVYVTDWKNFCRWDEVEEPDISLKCDNRNYYEEFTENPCFGSVRERNLCDLSCWFRVRGNGTLKGLSQTLFNQVTQF